MNIFPSHPFPGVLRRWMSCAQEWMSSPRDSLHCMLPRKTHWLSHVPGWRSAAAFPDVGLCPSQCTQSPLHFTDRTLNFSVLCTSPVCQQGVYRKSSADFSLPRPPLLPPSLSTDVTGSYVKSGRSYYTKKFTSRACHSPALLDICRHLWFQSKSKEVVIFFTKKNP